MPSLEQRPIAAKRVRPTDKTWAAIIKRAGNKCEWHEAGSYCGLENGAIDPIGGGRVGLTPDHKSPHSVNPNSDPDDPDQWQALCGRHQVTKKNYWDNTTGKLNAYAIVQAAGAADKKEIFKFLLNFYGYITERDGEIRKKKD